MCYMKFAFIISFICFAIILLNKKSTIAGMYQGIIFGGLLYYGIVPFILERFPEISNYGSTYYVQTRNTYEYLHVYLCIFVFYLIYCLSYRINFTQRKTIYKAKNDLLIKYLRMMGLLCFYVGGVSLVGFFGALGGLSNALAIAEKARSFNTALTDFMPYRASLLVVPARLITVAPFCFWSLKYLMTEERDRRSQNKYMVISFALAALFYMFNAGRAQIAMILLCVFVPILKNRGIKCVWPWLILICCVSLPTLDILDNLFVYLQTGEFNEIQIDYFSYVKQFRYPVNNMFNAFDIGKKYGFRWGQDFVTAILDLVPGLSFEPSYVPTSKYLVGADWTILGGIPNDIITFSILQFHVCGLIIIPFILGKITRAIDEIMEGIENQRVRTILSTLLAVNSYLLIASADFVAIFRAFIMLVIPFAIYKSRMSIDLIELKRNSKEVI